MQKQTISPELLAGAVGLLRPYFQNLTAETLIQGIQSATVQQQPEKTELLSKREFGKRRGCSEMTIHRLIKNGKLPFLRISKRLVKIPSTALNIDFTRGK
ncbi:MAG TPA: hypothetical protein DD381_11315 [Lentisphaeria bacterium]|nr:MAG: hypothetical protein A2X47_12800 [Lentisphaerae bacterium GWF2_38_69]HBM16918.1 hypothetical protein [Lentisphaeria bacterium]